MSEGIKNDLSGDEAFASQRDGFESGFCRETKEREGVQVKKNKKGGESGIEPETSRTRSANHTTRPFTRTFGSLTCMYNTLPTGRTIASQSSRGNRRSLKLHHQEGHTFTDSTVKIYLQRDRKRKGKFLQSP